MRHDPVIDRLTTMETTKHHSFIAMDALREGHHNFQTYSMLCSSCGKFVRIQSLLLDLSRYKIEGDIMRLDCTVCNNFVAIQFEDDIININEIIGEGDEKDFWHEAKTTKDKIVYYILSQIIYPEFDTPNSNKFESVYDFADESDLVMVRWKKGVPIGFYTLKPKGTKISEINGEEYAMPTLDTAYVRSEYRGQGIGTEILDNVTKMFPDEEIGFSTPISDGMRKVLKKFLTAHKNQRFKFWEIQNCGEEGNRKLVWFVVNKKEGKTRT